MNDLIKVRNHIKIRQSLKDNEALGRAYFGNLWSENANINDLKQVANWMNKFVYLLSNGTFSETTVKMLSNDLFLPDMDSSIDDYVEKGNRFYENLKKLESKLNPRSKIIFKREDNYQAYIYGPNIPTPKERAGIVRHHYSLRQLKKETLRKMTLNQWF